MNDNIESKLVPQNMKRPRLAELVAAALREQIVNNDLKMLPSIDRLMQTFSVSAPVVREALRILEHEGLITVRRGQVGGAVVHRPSPEGAAYTLGIVLQSKGTAAADVAIALTNLEPVCVRLAAERPDRESTIVPALTETNEAMKALLYDEGPQYVELASRFHHQLVTGCGNDSLALVAWSLEWLWYSQPSIRARQDPPRGAFVDTELRHRGVAAHDAIIEAIAAGDAPQAERLLREHIEHPEAYGPSEYAHDRVTATHLRGDVSREEFDEILRERLGDSFR